MKLSQLTMQMQDADKAGDAAKSDELVVEILDHVEFRLLQAAFIVRGETAESAALLATAAVANT